ncbi:hypothetical protein [Pararobbsia silviterrae]|uniref:hypothetical protein n=1 Tax=Pararobbsia silviterrae TaxID=1792498 RepID=UPI0013143FD7|nr:hypothetical protein [Pararobbsia silviterrae]
MRDAAIRFLSSEKNMARVIDVCGWAITIAGVCAITISVVVHVVLLWPYVVDYLK